MGAFDDLIPSQAGAGAFDDLVPKKKPSSTLDTIRTLGATLSSAVGQGVGGIEAGVGTFLQDPAASALSGVLGARAIADRGITGVLNAVSPGSAQLNEDYQEAAQRGAQFATERRAISAAQPENIPARLGLMLERDGRRVVQENLENDRATNPELVRQQEAVGAAEGFIGTTKALISNPLAFTHTLARSVPDMAIGLGAGRLAATGRLAEAGGAAEAAAALAAKKGADAAGQAAAAQAAAQAVQASAVARASTVGMVAEGASSAYQGREGVYQQVAGMPLEKLQAAPRFRELLAQTNDPSKARELLANELADQVPLAAGAGTVAGTLITNRLFGGDGTAKSLAGVEKMTAKEFGRRVAQDSLEEGVQGVPEDATQFGAVVQADPEHQFDPAGSLAQNLAAGLAMGGGGHGAVFARQQIRSAREQGGTAQAGAPVQPASAPVPPAPAAAPSSAKVQAPAASAPAMVPTDEAQEALHKRVLLTSLDRVDEIKAEESRASERLAELSDPAAGYGPMFDQERADLQKKVGELAAEREVLSKDWPKAVTGATASFSTEAGARVEGQYALMSAKDLVTSHDELLKLNPAYPQELQPRDRDRAASEVQVAGIVRKLDPARLALSADASNGAPIVGADGLVESGNARTIAMKRVYQANGQKAEDYKQYLRENAAQFGLTPEQIDQVDKPVLVRVRSTPVNRAEFARQANASTVAQMSPSEQARSDSNRIDSMEDLQPDENGDFAGAASRPFVRRFMARLPATEQAGMVDASGALSTAGYARVRNAVLAKAYGDSPVLARMTESMDDNLRNVSKALMIAAPRVAQMRQMVGEGARHDADITPDLMAAVEELSRLKDAGTTVEDALAQAGMFGEQYSPETKELLQFLAANMRRPRRMADFLVAYMEALDAAGDPNQGSLLGDVAPPAKSDLLSAARRSTDEARTENGPQGPAADTQRGNAGENAVAGQAPRGEPGNAQGSGGGNQGNEPAIAGQGVTQAAMIDGRPYDRARDNFSPPSLESFLPQNLVDRARQYVEKFSAESAPVQISEHKRAAAVADLAPVLILANQIKPAFDQKVIDIAKRTGASGQILAAVKGQARAVEKMILDGKPASGLRDLVRATIVVQEYRDAQQVVDEILKEFDQVEVKDRTDAKIAAPVLRGESGFLPSGYGDVLVNVLINGMPAEIQVNIPEMLAAKSGEGHQLYEIERSQPEGSVLRNDLAKAQKELYSAAANASLVRAAATAASNSSFDFFMEKNPASDSGAGSDSGGQDMAGTSSSPISRNGLPSGNTTASAESSKSKNLQPGGNDSGSFTGAPLAEIVQQKGIARQPINTPEFKRWFGNSKVTDDQGRPLVMFHGTSANEEGGAFKSFDTYASNYGLMGMGGYFTADPEVASSYTTKGKGGSPTVYPVYLSVQNPIDMDAPADVDLWKKQFDGIEQFHEGGDTNESWYRAAEDWLSDQSLPKWEGAEAMQDGLRAMGFDGITHIGGGRVKSDGVRHKVVIAFDPEQVKSATGNNGQFDPASADIRLARGEGGGGSIDLADLEALAARIQKGMPNMPKVHVLATPATAPAALRQYILNQGAWSDVEGAMHDGEFYLFGSGLSDLQRAEHVLAEHEATHFGLRAVLGESLRAAMNMIYVGNAAVRREASRLQARGRLTNAEATEEVIVDIPSADLAQLKGWRKLVLKVRDHLAARGYEKLPAQLTAWVDGTLDEQQRADLYVADLVRAAREYMAGKRAGQPTGFMGVTRLSGTLAEDVEKQEKWLSAEAKARGFYDIEHMLDKDPALFEKLAELWRKKHPADTLLSRAPAADASKTVAERADDLIAKRARTAAPLDALAKAATRLTGVERLTTAIYNKAGFILDRYTPEHVKAGLVSDYGVPEAVIDQRAMLQGRQRVQLRQAGHMIDALSTLTRAESRVAYEWMNMDGQDPRAYVSMMQGLPEESVKVLQDVQKLIDRLSREAVHLGQLTPDAYERNKFAYLRRSYLKHTLEQTPGEKKARSRAISILGDQYKGRGLTEEASMKQIQNSAPEWWGRKLKDGKADTALKGQEFVRLEKRAPSGEGTKALEGMDEKQPGRILEVAYYPAGEALPAKFSDWNQAGTFEVRDVKGDKAVMWRDFTKEEREKMGEIDEARFAIAKTLHAMIHDVEVGRYLEWLSQNYAKKDGSAVGGQVVEASERYRDTFAPGEWVQVPDTKIAGTSVLKYGKLAGQYLPGPIWNDLRQVVNVQAKPLGETFAKILGAWKSAKTALSPAVHVNNVMSNFVMADWHDVTAGHVAKALRILMGAHQRDGRGIIGSVGNQAARMGLADAEAAREVLNRYLDSGGDIGGWATNEIAQEQITPLLEAMEKELQATGGQSAQAQMGVMSAVQHALHLRFPDAIEALKGSKPGKAVGTEVQNLLDLYQSEDDVFRLAAWLRAKEEGASDLAAGKVARRSFLDYRVNAPWIQAMRTTAWPFISFTYRAVPMLLETAAKKPHKLLKLMALAGGLNALGVLLAGGGDDERKLLPEEKAGAIWGMVPKLLRMPWNDAQGSPVYLDIRRFIPVGDVFDIGAGHSAIPMLPYMQPGGPLALIGEVVLNRSAFTGKAITLETDTAAQKAVKFTDHIYKAFMPNVLGIPMTYATTGVADAVGGKTDAFGREQSVGQAVASSFGLKLGSYPPDVLKLNLQRKAQAEIMEIDRNIATLKRQRQTNRLSLDDFKDSVKVEQAKKAAVMAELREKISQSNTGSGLSSQDMAD